MATMTIVTAAAVRRTIAPRATASTAATATSTPCRRSCGPRSAADREHVAELASARCAIPPSTAMTTATSPTANVTAATTIALAASTRPRRGLAASVVPDQPAPVLGGDEHDRDHDHRDQPREHADQVAATVALGSAGRRAGTGGAMSPCPVTVNRPSDLVVTGRSPGFRPAPTYPAGHGARPSSRRPAERSKAAVAMRGAAVAARRRRSSPSAVCQPGEAVNRPTWTVDGSPGSVRRRPGPVRPVGRVVPGDRVAGPGQPQPARGGRRTVPGRPAVSPV